MDAIYRFFRPRSVKTETYLDLLPTELLDIIYTMAARMDFESVVTEVHRRKETDSIWWNPSNRLIKICRERGGLQPRYYDMWALHPAFISYRDFTRQHYSMFDEEDEIESDIEEKFDIISCHGPFSYGHQGQCKHCLMFRYPCISKGEPLENQEIYQQHSSTKVDAFKFPSLAHQWDISDEPHLRRLGEELDHSDPGWRTDLALKERYIV